MTSPTGTLSGAERRRPAAAFTLIELILVMALLVIVIAAVAPTLSRFFHGRNLDSEAQRFLALTRYGQSRAISEGVAMRLWIDPDRHTYGLQSEYAGNTGNAGNSANAPVKNYHLDPDLAVEVVRNTRTRSSLRTTSGPTPDGSSTALAIRFLADGSVDESSPEQIRFYEDPERRPPIPGAPQSQSEVWITTDLYRLRYEIATNLLILNSLRR